MLPGTAPTSFERSSAELREQAISDLDAVMESAAAASEALRSYHSALGACQRHLDDGGRPSDMRTIFDIAAVRATVSDQLHRIEDERSASRLSLWRLLHADGMSITEIARAWGVSRQLVSRELAKTNRQD